MSKTYQAIVVGAGPAGSSAALTMARAGLDVALVERGTFPGEKNMFGALLHRMPSLERYSPISGNGLRWSGILSRRVSPS